MKLNDVKQARDKIAPWIYKTPLLTSETINQRLGYRLFFKCENFQVTNSFKIRGCLNALAGSGKQRCIARSSGNFAQALAWAGKTFEIPTTVIMPKTAPKKKIEGAKKLGADVVLSGPSHEEGYELLHQLTQELGARMLSSFDDELVIAGQGTIAIEVHDQTPEAAHFLAPVGGGGLASGCALALKELNPKVEMIVVEPTGAADYHASAAAGKKLYLTGIDTIADGLRSPSVGERNWAILQKYVDQSWTVDDALIVEAMQVLFHELGIVVEPSGATAFASLLGSPFRAKGDVVCVVSGGNVDRAQFLEWTGWT